jgi:hypothetical protein
MKKYGRVQRIAGAEARKGAKLTAMDQLHRLNKRLGLRVGAKKERARLGAIVRGS